MESVEESGLPYSKIHKFYVVMAYFLHLILCGCMDYLSIRHDMNIDASFNFPPYIDGHHISPHPSRLLGGIRVGNNCRGQIFQIPPIFDHNTKDQLHYLWFLDDRLVQPQTTIEPKYRSNIPINLTIDEQVLLSHLDTTEIPDDFFLKWHIVSFYVSDTRYTIPESRYIAGKTDPKEHSNFVYWIVKFKKDAC